ncbi:MAG: hypothetical protein ABIG39_03725 [Candidatus Micrarchaeota archaeon]
MVESPIKDRCGDPMAKKTKKARKGDIVRFTVSQEVLELLDELAGPNASVVIKAMSPAYSGNPEFNKFKVG